MPQEAIIQIAGIHDWEEADLCIACGVNYLGFPLRLPVHQEDLTEAEARAIIQKLPAHVKAVLITYLDKAEEIAAFCVQMGVSIVQLHGAISLQEVKLLKELAPGLEIIKNLVIRTDNAGELEQMLAELSPFVNYFITDTYDPQTGASGATGKTHDWEISRQLVEISEKPVILAGGINPQNIEEALAVVKPFGVDAHTGVEGVNGRKDKRLVEDFVRKAKAYFEHREELSF